MGYVSRDVHISWTKCKFERRVWHSKTTKCEVEGNPISRLACLHLLCFLPHSALVSSSFLEQEFKKRKWAIIKAKGKTIKNFEVS